MAENTENFEDLLNQSLKKIKNFEGKVVNGKIISIDHNHALVDVGLKSEGKISMDELRFCDKEKEVKIGDKIDVFVERLEDKNGEAVLSREKAKKEVAFDAFDGILKKNKDIEGKIYGKVKGGYTVDVDGVITFLPGSQVDMKPVKDISHLIEQKLSFKVLKIDRERGNIVISRKAFLEENFKENIADNKNNLKDGKSVEGIIKNITDYGAFVDLGTTDGLIHLTDISWKKVKHPSDILTLAQNVKVKVIGLDKEKFRVSLGLKQLEEDPWDKIFEKYEIGMKVNCHISNITDYGLFVQIEEEIEGLVHVSEIDWTNNNPNPYKVANVGDQIEVMILDIKNDKRRVSLGMKQTKDNPWENFSNSYNEGEKIKGKVKSITDFGVFVELDGGIDGLIHISDISWESEDSIDLSKFKKSEDIEAIVIAIDTPKQRISLGLKQLSNDPFKDYIEKNPKNTVVKGKVEQIDERNALILLSEEVKGLLNISEVSRDKVDDLRTIFKINDEVESKIIGFDKKNRTLKLSIKAKEEKEERDAIESYKAEEKESISKTSLGDLLKSKFTRNE